MVKIKKVVHVMRRFVPDKWGGTESVVFHLSREFTRRGIESPVFCTDMFSAAGTEHYSGVLIRRFRYCFPWVGLSAAARRALRLKGGSPLSLSLFVALLREKDLTVIHTHVQHRLGGMARTVARLRSIPYVASLHGGFLTLPAEQAEKMKAPFQGKLEWGKVFGWLLGSRRVLQDAAAIICVGRNEFEAVSERYPGKPVHYLPNGVDLQRFHTAEGDLFRKAYGFRPEERIVLCVSRIDYQKNQRGLVRAFSRFAKDHPEHHLVFIGAVTVEAYRDQLRVDIASGGLGDRITLIEGLRPDDPMLPSAYRAAEFFVLPSHHEPFGIVVLEAWAAGTPVVAACVGGIPGFARDRDNILFVEKDDELSLAARMGELADDAELRRQLVRAAYAEVSEKYDWAVIADQILSVYEQALENN